MNERGISLALSRAGPTVKHRLADADLQEANQQSNQQRCFPQGQVNLVK